MKLRTYFSMMILALFLVFHVAYASPSIDEDQALRMTQALIDNLKDFKGLSEIGRTVVKLEIFLEGPGKYRYGITVDSPVLGSTTKKATLIITQDWTPTHADGLIRYTTQTQEGWSGPLTGSMESDSLVQLAEVLLNWPEALENLKGKMVSKVSIKDLGDERYFYKITASQQIWGVASNISMLVIQNFRIGGVIGSPPFYIENHSDDCSGAL